MEVKGNTKYLNEIGNDFSCFVRVACYAQTK